MNNNKILILSQLNFNNLKKIKKKNNNKFRNNKFKNNKFKNNKFKNNKFENHTFKNNKLILIKNKQILKLK